MSTTSSPGRTERPKRGFHRWHRTIGVTAALFVTLLAVTGLLVNHTEALALDERHVQNPYLLAWYGVETPSIGAAFSVSGDWITQAGDQVYFNDVPLSAEDGRLVGAVALERFMVAATGETLWLLTPEGRLIESLGSVDGLPVPVQRLGIVDQRLLVKTPEAVYRADSALLEWSQGSEGGVQWVKPTPLPAEVRKKIVAKYRGPGMTLERVLLDLHSGRLFGSWGVYVMDSAALLFLFLAGTGIWMWAKSGSARRASRRRV